MSAIEEQTATSREVRLQGVSICPGIGMGCARLIDLDSPIPQEELDASGIPAEQDRYCCAVETARRDMAEHITTVHGVPSIEADAIFGIHQAILSDESFHDRVRNRIAAERKSAEFCLEEEATALISKFDGMKDPYFAARGEDIRDMAYNLLAVMSNGMDSSQKSIAPENVVVSRHLHASHVFLAQRSQLPAFASESRALLSHAAILLKGFAIASVGAVPDLLDIARNGDKIIVDGTSGLVIVRPSDQTERQYQAQIQAAVDVSTSRRDVVPCLTKDGNVIVLRANIENPEQVPLMFAHGLNGIGLFRTEFAIPAGGRVPSEDEQYANYRRVLEEAAGRTVILRTFDIGADKQAGLSRGGAGSNPALGVRGIRRHLLNESEELRMQLRAMLRAGCQHKIGIMFPMVTTLDDVRQAKRILAEVRQELRENGIQQSQNVVVGVMVETPAAAIIVKQILAEVDFISLGTNDLLQYFMAADRNNERVLHYSDATDPAFLWLLEYILDQARDAGRVDDVSVCGEIASDPRVLPHLLRLGYRSFSIAPVAAEMVREVCARAPTQ